MLKKYQDWISKVEDPEDRCQEVILEMSNGDKQREMI